MTPPVESNAPLLNAPLKEWRLEESFDTARECRKEQEDVTHRAARGESEGLNTHEVTLAFSSSQCICSDDRRLAR